MPNALHENGEPMSETTKLGPERCLMVKPDPSKHERYWIGAFTQGSGNIQIRLNGGWVIVDDPRNHLVNDYGQESKDEKAAVDGLDPVKTETAKDVKVQEKRKPGRPKKHSK